MSRGTTAQFKVMGSSKSATKYHVGTFMSETNFAVLPEPLHLARKEQAPQPKRTMPTHKFGYEPPVQDAKTLPLILEDGARTTTTGVYEETPGAYMVLVKEGTIMRAYPATSWFKFGAPRPYVEVDPNQAPAPVKSESVNTKIQKKLGGLLAEEKEDEDALRSRLRATRESRFAGATEDGNEVGEDYDFDVNFDNDETIAAAPEDEPEDGEELVPKKLSKTARKEMAKNRSATGEVDHNTWVYELLYGDSEDEDDDDEEEDDEEKEGGDGENGEDGTSGGRSGASKKRQRDGAADEGRETKRAKSAKPPKGVVQDEKFRRDRHAIITTLRSAFLNSPTLDSALIVKVLRNAIPTFAVGSKPGLPAAENQLRDYWSFILKQVLLEFTSSTGPNKFVWKEHQASSTS